MERLTTKFHNGYLFNLPGVKDEKAQEEYVEKLSMKLGEYEDAEEQGLLLRLPCKVGDTLYKPNPITLKEIVEIQIESIFITESRISISGRTTKMHYSYCCSPSDIGKTVFLTRKEAESALAEKVGAE